MNANSVIALIDDDQTLADAMVRYLKGSGFEVQRGASCADATALARAGGIDLFILDRNLPDGDGLAVAREIRTVCGAAVIILSGLGDVDDRVQGLNTGADDYLAKPAAPEELLARVQAVIRRSQENRSVPRETIVNFRSFSLDKVNNLLVGADELSRPLTGIESLILTILTGAKGDIIDKDLLSQSALNRPWQADDRSLDVHISRLRQKLRDIGVTETVIQTVRGQGYRFTAG